MKAYHSNQALKEQTIAAMQADIEAERLQAGHYWNGETGCFVGCVIRGNEHSKFEDVLGIPRILARLADRVFEGLSGPARAKFSLDFLVAIAPGTDLTSVWPKFAVFVLADKDHGAIRYARSERTKQAINDVAGLYRRIINGEKIDADTWLATRETAAAAAAAAADSTDSADIYAADTAADTAAYAAAADTYAAYAYARPRHYAALAEQIIVLLREAA